MGLRHSYHLKILVILLTCLGVCMESSDAGLVSRFWSCRDLFYRKVSPGPELKVRLAEMLNQSRVAIEAGDTAAAKALSEKLLNEAIAFHREIGTPIYVDPEGRWMDILPEKKGNTLSHLSEELEALSVKSVLRYQPSQLFQDAYLALDQAAQGKSRAVYLTHQDVFGKKRSAFLSEQLTFQVLISGDHLKKMQTIPDLRLGGLSPEDHARDWLASSGTSEAPLQSPRSSQLIDGYLARSSVMTLLPDPLDPFAVRYGPGAYLFRNNVKDYRGLRHRMKREGSFLVERYQEAKVLDEKAIFDIFLHQVKMKMYENAIANHALVLSDGRTLVHVFGADEDSRGYFESHLQFIEGIYTDPKGLAVGQEKMDQLRFQSREVYTRSHLVAWVDRPEWIRNPAKGKVTGGMIFVLSRSEQELLPIEMTNRGLSIPRNPDEILVEMGRLGSLSPYATIEFLKVAGAALAREYPKKKVRVICEADGSRAAYFKRFGFKPSDIPLAPAGYYPSGTDQIMEVDLDGFLRAVFK